MNEESFEGVRIKNKEVPKKNKEIEEFLTAFFSVSLLRKRKIIISKTILIYLTPIKYFNEDPLSNYMLKNCGYFFFEPQIIFLSHFYLLGFLAYNTLFLSCNCVNGFLFQIIGLLAICIFEVRISRYFFSIKKRNPLTKF